SDMARLLALLASPRTWLAAAISLVLCPPALHALMVARLSLAEVTQQAARIVHATVSGVRSGRDDTGLPATWITLTVVQTLKGPEAAQLMIKQYGVDAPLSDGTVTRLSGMPQYRVGEEIVLFLRADSREGFTSPVGLTQGAYRVQRSDGKASV